MKSGIALVVFVVVCTLSGQAVSAQTCGHGHAARPSGAVAREQPPRPAPSVMAIAGLALLATGAATRRGAMERT